MSFKSIIIEGAREHNLKNINLEIPRDKLVVITGLSGSGKSSLAFDTIYAEGQRRYVESLSVYARQFLELMEKPDVDRIEGLSPAISIEQKTTSKNPRSTVGTITEIYDYLRLLFARIGKTYCYKCGSEISSQSVQQISDKILELPEGTKIWIMSPIARGKKGEYRKILEEMIQEGFVRARIDGEVVELDSDVKLDKKKKHDIEIIVDRLIVKKEALKRIVDSLEIATKLSNGEVVINIAEKKDLLFSEKFACPNCNISIPELTPRVFSFNNPYGACPVCSGLGTTMAVDPDLVIPDRNKTLREGVIAPWGTKFSRYYQQILKTLSENFNFDLDLPFANLPERTRNLILYGSAGREIDFVYETEKNRYQFKREFEGVINSLNNRYRETSSDDVREEIERFMRVRICPECRGDRLKKEYLAVEINDRNIMDISRLSIKEALYYFDNLKLKKRELEIAARILKEIKERLNFLIAVGLDYITLDRSGGTLSGGEGQRIRLATQIGSSLIGVLYILDEPSIGLHHRDNKKLLATLKKLRDIGNTVLVVEHDAETIFSADYVVDLGPGAGKNGGELVAAGTPKEIVKSSDSITGKYLSGELFIPVPETRRKGNEKYLEILGAGGNNLKKIDIKIPIGIITCVTGVSGSGKSTLILDTLYRALAKIFYDSHEVPCRYKEIRGIEYIDKVIDIDQSPIGRTPRSNPATYTGLFSPIRDLYSQVSDSRIRGYNPGRFSFNVKGGRCDSCEGDGMKKIEMHFLPDIYVTCEVCNGKRYNRETLDVRYKGKNIAETLDMTVEQALEFYENISVVKRKLKTLYDVGLGYIKLGQSATTLSGGEAQRVKLAKELSKVGTGMTLYILDEPTTGLHFADIQKLLDVLNKLADAGNTIVVIEHNLDVIKSADYIVDLGPEGGDLGGEVIACGTPEEIIENDRSYTGQVLKMVLKRK